MLIVEIVAYLLIALQLDLVLCMPQSQNFNGSNPYYDSYLNQYGGVNSFGNNNNQNPYVTTQKSLYPTLYPQAPTPAPQPHYAKGQYNPTPQPNYFNRNSSHQNPSNAYGNGGQNNSYGWNSNFNPHTTPSSTYQPYGQYGTTTVRPAVTTLPPFYPKGSFNQYNRTSPTTHPSYPGNQYNRMSPTYPSYNTNPVNSYNRTSPTYPSYNTNPVNSYNRTSPTYPPYNTNPGNQYNRTSPTYPPYNTNPGNQYNRTSPTYPTFNTNPGNQYNRTSPTYPTYNTNPTYPPYRPDPKYSNPILPQTYPDNRPQSNFNQRNNNTFPATTNWNRNNTTPQHQYPYPSHTSQNTGQGTKNNNFPNNYNFNPSDNNYHPQYQPSAPPLIPTKPNIDQNGIPLATFTTFHANKPTDDNLFNFDNLHGRRPNNDYQYGQLEHSNVPLAPFPGERAPSYDSISNVPLAPFPGRRYKK